MDLDRIDTLHFLIQELQNRFDISVDDQDIGLCYQILEEEREYINKCK